MPQPGPLSGTRVFRAWECHPSKLKFGSHSHQGANRRVSTLVFSDPTSRSLYRFKSTAKVGRFARVPKATFWPFFPKVAKSPPAGCRGVDALADKPAS